MRKKRNEHKFRSFMGKFLPYAATFLVILGIAKVGSESKNDAAAGSINMNEPVVPSEVGRERAVKYSLYFSLFVS